LNDIARGENGLRNGGLNWIANFISLDNPDFKRWLAAAVFGMTYRQPSV